MQAFDLKKVKDGAKLVTRSGKSARIVCYDRIDNLRKGHILALVCNNDKTWERPVFYNDDGTQVDFERHLDLLIQDD